MERTESDFIFAKFFDSYCESRSNTSSTLNLLAVYQLFHDENGLVGENCHWAETTCEDEEEDEDYCD